MKKSIIVSIKGTNLSNKEKALLSNEKPWGLILFKRNIKSFNQIVNLIKKIRNTPRIINFLFWLIEKVQKYQEWKVLFNMI